ncbi:MAG: M4 family metallopeptidase, partial [Tunicatimonas sp.]
MNCTKALLATAFLVLLSNATFAQSNDPWAIKKQRNGTIQPPSFPYQTRNGAATKAPLNARVAKPLPRPLSLNYRLAPTGPAGEPPREIRGTLPAAANARANLNLPEAAQHYLTEARSLMRIELPEQEFVAQQQWKDDQGTQHLRLQQHYRGVPVYGSEIIVHADPATTVQGLNGRYIASPTALNPMPTVNETDAVATSLARFRREGTLQLLTSEQKQLLNYSEPEAELVILPTWEALKPTLAWRVLVRPNFLDHWEVFIDAHSGQPISQTNLTCTFVPALAMSDKPAAHTHEHAHHYEAPSEKAAAPWRETTAGKGSGVDLNGVNRVMETWQTGGFSYLVDATKDMFQGGNPTTIKDLEGVLITYDAERVAKPKSVTVVNAPGTSFSDPAAVSAHYNASLAYDYFRNVHGRNAIDGRGGNVLSVVNFVDEDGEEMDNAFWNGELMVYGNGNRGFKPLAGDTDVGGHEMTHGVIGSTANLVYRNQSGAINEHIADVFGVL